LSCRIALVKWTDHDELAEAIRDELVELGHQVAYFRFDQAIPDGVDVVFSFAPYGRLLQIPKQLVHIPRTNRPIYVHWNTEGLPDLRMPWHLMYAVSACRSWIGRLNNFNNQQVSSLVSRPPLSRLHTKLTRFRYLGDFFYAQRMGWVDVFADISSIYAQFFNKHGLPAMSAPFGGFPGWSADLGLERDIDVLWMGKRATKRRGHLLDRLRKELHANGVEIHVVDNVENPFVFGQERTCLLNRTKITLNLLRTWYDENSLRICIAAPNRSLVVSEPLLPHVPDYHAGFHYVSAPIDKLAETILYYLEHSDERQRIVENAYQLLTTTLTMSNSIKIIMEAVDKTREAAFGPWNV